PRAIENESEWRADPADSEMSARAPLRGDLSRATRVLWLGKSGSWLPASTAPGMLAIRRSQAGSTASTPIASAQASNCLLLTRGSATRHIRQFWPLKETT